MKLISTELGLTKEKVFLLAGVPAPSEEGIPLGKKSTPEIIRIEKNKLEQMYISNPVVFNSINKIVQIMMAAGYSIIGEDESVKVITEFLDSVGEIGGEYDWDTLLETIVKHCSIYGNAWIEKIYNKAGTRIVDLDFIDPKKMDYARDSNQKIVLDKFNRPVGYVQTLPMDIDVENKIEPPEGVVLPSNSIFIPPERIIHFQLYTVGDGFDGIGLIEPIYKTAIRKLNMEQALANSWWLTGFPLKKGKVGDINHEPTEEQLKRMAESIKNLDYKSSIVLPYYADVEILEAKRPERLKEQLNYFIDQEITGLGMPKAFATGLGEETNRATLARQEYLLKLSLKDITTRIARTITTKLFKPLAEMNKMKSYPTLKWGEIAIEELDSKSKRLIAYAQAGIIRPDKDLETYIRKVEGLPEKPRTQVKE